MSLLELPDDVFHMVTDLVKDMGPEALLSLRATSRLLLDEVNDIVYVQSSVDEVKAGPHAKFVHHNTGLYLFGKFINPRGVQPELPALVQKMSDHLCSALGLAEAEDRLCCERHLCEGLVQYYGGPCIRQLLWCQEAATGVAKLSKHYKGLAALLFGTPVVRNYLWRGDLDVIPTLIEARPTPLLVHAVASEDVDMVDQVIAYYNKRKKTYIMPRHQALGHMKTALSLAFKQSRADFACKIAQGMKVFIERYLHIPNIEKLECQEWLDSAVPLGSHQCVQIIAQLRPAEIPVRNRHFTLALQSSSFEVVKALFDVGKVGVNDTLLGRSPIKIACGAGNISVIKGLVELGAQVPKSALSHALKHDKLEAVLYLWRLGYQIPTLDKWPRKCSQAMYDTLCTMNCVRPTRLNYT